MRTDIRGIQSAQKTTSAANELLAAAESGLANISRILTGDINNKNDNGLIGLIYDDTVPAAMKQQQIRDILALIDGTIRTTTYNGKQLLNGSMDYRLSGVDTAKLSNVAVSRAAPETPQGQTVNVKVLEQAEAGTLNIDAAAGLPLTAPFDLRIEGTGGKSADIHLNQAISVTLVINAINAQTGVTGITARDNNNGQIALETVETGSKQSVSVTDKNHTLIITDSAGTAATSANGKDILVTVNGRRVQGDGQQVRFAADDLSLSMSVSSALSAGQQTSFRVAGGGLLFQLGKDVQTPLQYRMALPSMTASHLGGASGVLEDLRTIDLNTDAGKAKAFAIVSEAVNQVAVQRGTIGAVQKNVLQSNANNLDIQLEKVSESEGLISNADMALESSRLNRAELLAQSAMEAILHSRQFRQFILNSLVG
jgi:flagellin